MLQTEAEAGFEPVQALEYEGGYPIARLALRDAALPVEVSLEAFNPMIPLDTANSSIPCAIFRITAKNPGKKSAEVTLSASLQNAVGSQGAAGIHGVKFAGYGGNRNRVVGGGGWTAVAMDQLADPAPRGPVKVRAASGLEVEGPELVWLDGAGTHR